MITVSRALRTPEKVAPETRRRVEDAVRALGYFPNLVAGALASRRSQLVTVIVPTLRNSVFATTIQGLSDTLKQHRYHLILGYVGYSEAEEAVLVPALLGRQPDGIVLTGVEHEPSLRELLTKLRVPTIEIWDVTNEPIDIAIGFDNVAAGETAARHLLERGSRHPALIALYPEGEHRSRKRILGFTQACDAAGLRVMTQFVDDGMSTEEGTRAFRALLESHPDVDGVFCVNDALALAALMEARRMNVAVPRRVRIVGFGDFDIAAHAVPRLTTVRAPGYAIGERAAKRILARIEGHDRGPPIEDLGFELIVRESS